MSELSEKARTHLKGWEQLNPSPPLPPYLDRKPWASGLRKEQITTEMREERRQIEEHNQELSQAHNVVVKEWCDRRREERRRFLFGIGELGSALDDESWIHSHPNPDDQVIYDTRPILLR